MCGIAGIVGIQGEPVYHNELKAMCDAMARSGPDEGGYFIGSNLGLGMRRAAIPERPDHHQPGWNQARNVCVIMNGRISNSNELRRQLQSRGHVFRNHCDTELIANLYEEKGEACVQQLCGTFTFAIWDSRNTLLLLVRDRLGIKPLYYAETNGRLLFASQIKALLQLPDIRKDLNWEAIGYLFSFLSTPPDLSVLKSVHKLPPGHMLTLRQGGRPQLRRYWDVQVCANRDRSDQDSADAMREHLDQAVRYCMADDVPVAMLLSGSPGASAVAAIMAQQQPSAIQSFYVGMTDAGVDQRQWARDVSQAIGMKHHELMLDADITDYVHDLAWDLDEPFGDSSAIATFMLARQTSEHTKVIMSGDGGDCILAAYDKHATADHEDLHLRLPKNVRNMANALTSLLPDTSRASNFLRRLTLAGEDSYLDTINLFAAEQKMALFRPDVAEHILDTNSWRHARQSILAASDNHWPPTLGYQNAGAYLPMDSLTRVDSVSMANSLEIRSPLLDHRLIEFSATIPSDLILPDDHTSTTLKLMLRGLIPDTIINRKTAQPAIPLAHWFRGNLNTFVSDLLLSSRSHARGIFHTDYIRKLLSMHERSRPLGQQLWMLVSFELWCRAFLDRHLVPQALSRPHYKSFITEYHTTSVDCPELLVSYSDCR